MDIISYPGLYGDDYIVATQGEAADSKEAISDINDLLPKCELIVSHGRVLDEFRTQTTTSYRVSTIGGMSGSPVVINGKAVGSSSQAPVLISRGPCWLWKRSE